MATRPTNRRSTKNRRRIKASPEARAARRGKGARPEPEPDLLDDPFFYESPFPPEVTLETSRFEPEPEPPRCSPELMARRRKLRTFVALVVGAAFAFTLAGLGKSWLAEDDGAQPPSITVPVSP